MDTREQRGLQIAATTNLKQNGNSWMVPSQTGVGRYAVVIDGDRSRCECPDFETREQPCKHIFAVQYAIQRELSVTVETTPEGVTTVTETEVVTETVKVTYGQDWKNYNAGQVNEKRLLLPLLAELCSGVAEPEAAPTGRPRLPIADQLFASVYKVYSTVSSRRFMSDLAEAHEKGFISKVPHFNSVLNYLEDATLTPILKDLIVQSSLPLRAVECDFCVDSTGLSTSRFEQWFSVKHHGVISKRTWVKLHAMVGVKTNIITSVEVTGKDGADTTQFAGMVEQTAQNFPIREVSADKAYGSRKNYVAVEKVGGQAYIPFKSDATGRGHSTGKGEGVELWSRMFHYYSFNRAEFLTHYHKRSNSESTFSMLKAKFGSSLRSKSDTALVNEALCKVLAHNLCCVVSSIYELGIEASFTVVV